MRLNLGGYMASPVPAPAEPNGVPTTTVLPPGATPAAAAVAAQTGGSITSVKDMGDLKKKAPKVYNAMMQGIAWNIITDAQHHLEEWKKALHEGDKEAGY